MKETFSIPAFANNANIYHIQKKIRTKKAVMSVLSDVFELFTAFIFVAMLLISAAYVAGIDLL